MSEHSFREDPLRILRGLRLVSQLGLRAARRDPRADAQRGAPGSLHVSAERIGGGIAADGMGELSKLLLGREPARALRLARDTGVLELIVPEFAAAIGFVVGLAATAAHARRAHSSRSSSTRPTPTPRSRCFSPRSSTISESRVVERDHATPKPACDIPRRRSSRLRYPTVLRREVVGDRRRPRVPPRPVARRRRRGARDPAIPRPARRRARADRLVAAQARRSRCEDRSRLGAAGTRPARARARRRARPTASAQPTSPSDGNELIALGFRTWPAARSRCSAISSPASSMSRRSTTATSCSLWLRRSFRERRGGPNRVPGGTGSCRAGRHHRRRDQVRLARGHGRPRGGRGRGRRREPRSGSRSRSTPPTATPFAGISSVGCSRTRREPSTSVCELVHAVDTDTAARRLEVPVAPRGQSLRTSRRRAGSTADEIASWARAVSRDPRADDDAAVRRRRRGLSRRASSGWRRWQRSTAFGELSMGTSQDWQVAVEEGATLVRIGSALWRNA